MKKMLMVANEDTTIYNFRREVIQGFLEAGFQVTVCLPYGDKTDNIRALGCEMEYIDVNRHGRSMGEDVFLFLKYLKLIRRQTPYVVLTYTIKPNVYASLACQLCGVPYMNNITGLGASMQEHTFLALLVIFLQRLAYRKSSCVFFQNNDNLKTFRRFGIIKEKTLVRLLPGSGVNLSLHKYEPFPENDGVIRFVTVARIQRAKGYEVLLPVAERIKEKYPNTEFHVVGWFEEDEFKDEVDRLVRAKVIIYHGAIVQEAVHRVIAQCNCLVHPTYHEGMSNVCMEAAAAGRSIIASDIPGCRETFDEGISGYGFKVKDADALYAVLEKFIQMPREAQAEMGRRGRLKMEKEFNRQIVVDAYLEEIQKIVKKAS